MSTLCAFAQDHSVLSTGIWYKFAVTESNIYAINGNDLVSNGVSISDINPAQIRIFGHPGGMLPQPNNQLRYSDLEELAIEVIDGNDNSFDPSDKIIFWAEGPDLISFNEVLKTVAYENNIYSDTSYYYLNINQADGKRVQTNSLITGNYPVVSTHIAYYIHELDQTNILKSGREWYGESFNQTLSRAFETDISDWEDGSTAYLTSSVMAASYNDSKFTVTANNNQVGTQLLYKIPDSQYGVKGAENTTTFPFTLGQPSGNNMELKYSVEKQGGIGYLNYFILQVEQTNNFNTTVSQLLIPKKIEDISTLEVSNINSNTSVWDVTEFNSTRNINYEIVTNTLNANIITDTTSWIVVFDANSNLPSPQFINEVENQDIHGIQNIDLLIVTPPEFLTEARQLENYKIENGISAIAITTTQIYNEFSAGRQDVTAIRDYAKYLYDYAGLKYLLLFGKGTYDYKDIEDEHTSFVPIYESRNSLSPLYTYGSDDYLGFMEPNEGMWQENSLGDHTLDIGVGRLPIKTKEEARAVVSKIELYQSKSTIGKWKKKVLFVAENGDGNLHQRDAEKLSVLIDTTYNDFDPKKIYVDSYPIEVLPTRAPEVNQAINESLKEGVFIVNYTGHGDEHQWANSNIFNKDMIENLSNEPLLPLFVTATCEFGRHDNTNETSGGEELVVMPNHGAIGIITTSRPVFAPTNYALNLAFYNAVFSKENGNYKTLGEIFIETKNNSLNGVNNRNFSLLADPSLKLAYPEKQVQLDSLNGILLQTVDTIHALDKVLFNGTIRNSSGGIENSFNGEVIINFWDRPVLKQTLGNFETPFIYQQRSSSLFSGSSTVTNGQFKFEFVVPADIDYQFENGKVSMYAISEDSTDANGSSVSIIIGGSSQNPPSDFTPPDISLFLEDSTFKNNDLVSANSLLIANLFDENGINLSETQVGHSITYILDDAEPISLSTYFEYEKDSYQKGKLIVPLYNMKAGKHTLTLKVWDTFNNFSEAEINFRIGSNNEVAISDVSAYPNPVQDHANFSFKHNLSGNELNVTLQILNRLGEVVYTKEYEYKEPNSLINDIEWNGRNATGQKLIEGIYIYSINIRSIDSGAHSSFFGRLMIIN